MNTPQYSKNQEEIEVYKNPKLIKNFVPYARGLTTPDYDFYIADDAWNILHTYLGSWLKNNVNINPLIGKNSSNAIKNAKKGWFLWQRQRNKNYFIPSSIYEWSNVQKNFELFDEAIFKLNQKFDNYKFEIEEIEL